MQCPHCLTHYELPARLCPACQLGADGGRPGSPSSSGRRFLSWPVAIVVTIGVSFTVGLSIPNPDPPEAQSPVSAAHGERSESGGLWETPQFWSIALKDPLGDVVHEFPVFPSLRGYFAISREEQSVAWSMTATSPSGKLLPVRRGVRSKPGEPLIWRIDGAKHPPQPELTPWRPDVPLELRDGDGFTKMIELIQSRVVDQGEFGFLDVSPELEESAALQDGKLVGWLRGQRLWLWRGSEGDDLFRNDTVESYYKRTFAGSREGALCRLASIAEELEGESLLRDLWSSFSRPRVLEAEFIPGKLVTALGMVEPEVIASMKEFDASLLWERGLVDRGGAEAALIGLELLGDIIGYGRLDDRIEKLYERVVVDLSRQGDEAGASLYLQEGLGYYNDNKKLKALSLDLEVSCQFFETDNFLLRSTTTEAETQIVLKELERFRYFVRTYLDDFVKSRAEHPRTAKANVYVFRNYDEYLHRQERLGMSRKFSWGHYSRRGDSVFLYNSRPHASAAILDVLRHELVHQVLTRAHGGKQASRWISEGLAEALSEVLHDSQGLSMMPVRGHRVARRAADMLRDKKLIPLEELVSMGYEEFLRPKTSYRNYQQSGALVLFLLTHDDGAYAKKFLRFAATDYLSTKKSKSLADALGVPLTRIEEQFVAFLEEIPKR